MGIGKMIKLLRERAGMTQEQLAERLEVTPSAVGNYERDVSFPREEILYRIFKALDCEPNELFTDYYRAEKNPGRIHLELYRELDEHGRELVDACTAIEHRRCCESDGLTAVAARSFGRNEYPEKIMLKKRRNAGSILDAPDYKE